MHAIGNGTAPFAQAFADEVKVDFPIYTDPSRNVYRAFDMRNEKLSALKPKAWKNALRARKGGFKQTAVRGDPFQNGGVVVVQPGGAISYVHVESEVGDLADLDMVLSALKGTAA